MLKYLCTYFFTDKKLKCYFVNIIDYLYIDQNGTYWLIASCRYSYFKFIHLYNMFLNNHFLYVRSNYTV